MQLAAYSRLWTETPRQLQPFEKQTAEQRAKNLSSDPTRRQT